MLNMKYTFTRLLVDQDDFSACFDFYKNVLGFKVTWGEGDNVYASFDTGVTNIAINAYWTVSEPLGLPADRPQTDRAILIFEVENVDAAYEDLQTRGVTFTHPPTDRADWGIRTAHFRDPAGNLLEINQYLSQ
jgi:catechol 2,3-dioxygenase-like lactoylglutathione lyase family enzyme